MAKFKIPVSWEVCSFVHIEAESLEDALNIFDETEDSIALPVDPEYVDASFRREEDIDTIKAYNSN